MKGLLRMFTQGDRCTLLAGASGKHVEKFGHFKEFLGGNRNALRALAELEMLYYSGQSFTSADIAFQYEQLFGQVRALVNALNNLSEHRYALLNQQADAINAHVRRVLRPPVIRHDLPAVVALADLPATATGDAGGKAANLARIAQETDLLVPPGFVVTASGYDRFLKDNHLDQLVLDELAGLSPNDPQLAEVSERLVSLILGADVPEELVSLLQAHYHTIEQQTRPGIRLAMRSSAVREDSEASFAGQYRSVLNVGGDGLAAAYKEVVASSFSPRAISYRQMAGIDLTETPMCVLGLAMVDVAASGVLYTADPAGVLANSVQISALLGLGELLVSGHAAADTFVFDRETGTISHREIAVKGVRLDAVADGTEEHQVSEHEAKAAAITDEETGRLARAGIELEALFGGPQDIEWAIDRERRLFILQCRPLQVAIKATEPVPEPEAAPLLQGGVCASQGICAGKVQLVDEQTDLSSVPDHALVVAKTASPRYAEIMGRISGLITEVGSTTCHLASVAREFGVPMAVNLVGAVDSLTQGTEITLFVQERPSVYSGLLIDHQPVKRRIMDSSVHRMLRAVLDLLSPLHLTDPHDPSFRPENCASIHDIIRFAHEQVVREMFGLSSEAEDEAVTVRLTTHIPLVLNLIDLGGGLKPGLSTCDTVTADHFISSPIQALWRGFTHPGINWSGTVQFDGNRFLTRLAASATSEFGPEPGGDSYALIGADYLNLSAKFGYHFATLDTFCGDEPDHNYLNLQFSGGAGSFFGKTLRLQFLAKVLGELGCAVNIQGDLLEATLNRHARVDMLEQLDQIGRLLASSRLLDMAITNQEDVDTLAADFMAGNYDLLNRKDQTPLPGFYTHLGHWRQVEEEGEVCWQADGSRWLGTLSTGVSGVMTKTLGRSYQELLDTIGAYYYFPLAISKSGEVSNGVLSLKVKPLHGSIDQAGGLVFGLRNIGNYFVFRINALEDNAILFEFINNNRVERGRCDMPITKSQWHTLEVSVMGSNASCLVNGEVVFEYQADRSLHGYIGLWTKADSVTQFSCLTINNGATCLDVT
ncbi:MAG: PEP/pyruvate-binding domain-containing protein [Desulfobulbus sp.]|nr:PEP/pyruvate-binding domain-containing protein [Desulfobulbus sp.]